MNLRELHRRTGFWATAALMLAAASIGSDRGHERPGALIGVNFRIYPSSVTQTETFITRHPTNPDILFASANTIDGAFVSEGIYVSTNGGTIWTGNDVCNGQPITFHNGDPGIAIDKDGRFLLVRLGFSPGLYSHFSTDNGSTWSNQQTISLNDQDRATLVSDGLPTSSHYGRSYAVWVRRGTPFYTMFSFVDAGFQNWSDSAEINNPDPSHSGVGGEAAIGPSGSVNVCWARAITTSPFTEDFVGFASSTNGGASWTVLEYAFDMNGIMGLLSQKANIRVNGLPRIDVDRSGGARNGWIYIATTQKSLLPAGNDPDIIMNRSTDGGATWSPGIRVNQDGLNNGKIQYFPAVHVDDYGGLNILYYDDRNTTSDSAGVYLSRSTNGGDTWSDFQVSSHNFKPAPIGGLGQGYQGDNIGMTSTNDTLWPVWMDNSTGIYQIWTSPLALSELTPVKDDPLPMDFRLNQNFPNPFNPSTTIEYVLPKADVVRLEIYDVTGKKVITLVNRRQAAGNYAVNFRAGTLSSGVYLYRLTTSEFSATRTMLLVK